MNTTWTLLGFLIMLICQDIVAVRAMPKSRREGILCAMIPGYLLIHASREGTSQYTKPLIGWFVGLGLVGMGFLG